MRASLKRVRIGLLTMLSLAVALPVLAESSFEDIDGNPHEPAIERLAAAQVVDGCYGEPPRYCPGRTVTRAQMAKYIARAAKLGPATRDYFDDDYYSLHHDSINRVAEAGIAAGVGPRTFRPHAPVSRAQMATFLVAAFSVNSTDRDYFTDDDSSVHEASINAIAGAKMVSSCRAGARRYCPDAPVRRDQMATLLANGIDAAGDESSRPSPPPSSGLPPAPNPLWPPPAPQDPPSGGPSGRPNASNTGPRIPLAEMELRTGRVIINEDGAIVEGIDVDGYIEIAANNVTLQDFRVRSRNVYPVRVLNGFSGTVVQYCEIDGRNAPENNGGVSGSGVTLRFCNLHGHTDGVKMGSDSIYESNWIHSPTRGTDDHVDGMQSTGQRNIIIRGNNVVMPSSRGSNSAIIIKSNFAVAHNYLIEGNWLNGGGYTVYVRGSRDFGPPTAVRIHHNRFGRDYRFGLFSTDGRVDARGNVWDDNGQPVDGNQ